MRVLGGHHDGVAVRLMRADFFAFVKGQKRDADEGILGERLAHDLAFLVADLIFLR